MQLLWYASSVSMACELRRTGGNRRTVGAYGLKLFACGERRSTGEVRRCLRHLIGCNFAVSAIFVT